MQVAAHHQAGQPVLVECYRRGEPNYFATGTVEEAATAEDRSYRVTVKGSGAYAGKCWQFAAPECVHAANRVPA